MNENTTNNGVSLNTLSKEIALNTSQESAFKSVVEISKIEGFTLESENNVLNKIILKYSIYKVEIHVEKVSDSESKLKISILDGNNSRTINLDKAANVLLNFENALTAVVSGKPETFVAEKQKTDNAGCFFSVLKLIIALALIFYAIQLFFLS